MDLKMTHGLTFLLENLNSGGDGNRTRVLKSVHPTFYMFMRFLLSEIGCEPPRHPSPERPQNFLTVCAVAPQSSQPTVVAFFPQ